MGESNFSFVSGYQEKTVLGLGMEACMHLSWLWNSTWLRHMQAHACHHRHTYPGPVHATTGIRVSVLLCLEGLVFLMSSITSDSCNLSVSSSTGFLSPKEKDLMEIAYLGLSVPGLS